MIAIAATQNKHKIEEMRAITEFFGFQIYSMKDAGFGQINVEEDGKTFEENSLKKAMEIHRVCGMITIADDSGLMVDALNGAPGVQSARFAGEDGNDGKNIEKLMELLGDLPWEERKAKFVTVIAMVFSEKTVLVAKGECKGHILYEKQGDKGFGYDPIFVPDGYKQSFGQLGTDVKNKISHRAKALQNLKILLEGMHE
ncbi:MAG: RdgB/HAM1 family non-canonical purine NTP pyrophosphatase [Eubacteriales bacterium]|nr:RdgB/HAM1 family non-canonical purine NTP pyrophosphatase [Eubacteriales bacterium]MDD4583210.1 RdgB/HAM1 family non-canonical purine NTP pyrophosphatase [Eubacteriales bacterium]